MLELEIRAVRDACATLDLPSPFVLVGRGGTNVVGSGPGEDPYVIDAEGVILRAGAVYTWCRNGCCDEIPRRWKSVDEAADFHASYIIEDDTVRLPGDEAGSVVR